MVRDPERHPTPKDEEQRRVALRFALLWLALPLVIIGVLCLLINIVALFGG